MTTKIANRDCAGYVRERMEFQGSNLRGREYGSGTYLVESYGTPIALCDAGGAWWINACTLSKTTTRHMYHVRGGIDRVSGYFGTVRGEYGAVYAIARYSIGAVPA